MVYNRVMKIFMVEKNIESVFSAVFKSFYDKIIPDLVVENEAYNQVLGDEVFIVLNNKSIYERVENTLIKYGGFDVLFDVKLALCSNDKDALTKIFNYLYFTFYSKKDVSKDLSSPFVCEYNYLLAKVKNEINKVIASLKFVKNINGRIYSEFAPKNDIIEMIAPTFIKKLSGLPFEIYDTKRNKRVFSDGKNIVK